MSHRTLRCSAAPHLADSSQRRSHSFNKLVIEGSFTTIISAIPLRTYIPKTTTKACQSRTPTWKLKRTIAKSGAQFITAPGCKLENSGPPGVRKRGRVPHRAEAAQSLCAELGSLSKWVQSPLTPSCPYPVPTDPPLTRTAPTRSHSEKECGGHRQQARERQRKLFMPPSLLLPLKSAFSHFYPHGPLSLTHGHTDFLQIHLSPSTKKPEG